MKVFPSPVPLTVALEAVRGLDPGEALGQEELRILLLRNFTANNLDTYLRFHCLQEQIPVRIKLGGHDQILQEVMAPGFEPWSWDMVVIALVFEELVADYDILPWSVQQVADRLVELFEAVRTRTDTLLVINTFIPPLCQEMGFGGLGPASLAGRVRELNRAIERYAASHSGRVAVIDHERLLALLGYERSVDARLAYLYRAPFRPDFLDLYAREIVKIGRALKGKAKKCLVLDCDNTLWGGVIGEDGLGGIRLDPHEFPGKAYYDFQKSVLLLARRGVLVALCSKNNEEDVWAVLDNHPACLLKREHIAAYRINWNPKPANLAAIASELNLGLDHLLFIDDSKFECDMVRHQLPAVTVRQVPTKLADYPLLPFVEGWFDSFAVSREDQNRTRMMQEEAQRREYAKQFEDIEQYLASLGLVATIHQMKEGELSRVSQLTQRTNQFNLTTRRYSEAEVEALASAPDAVIYTLAVQDRFGDYGLTGVFIARRLGKEALIDTLLLSCRILGRNLEWVFVRHCLQDATRRWNPAWWRAEYVPTPKNQQTERFWEEVGFLPAAAPGNTKLYRARPAELRFRSISYISIETEGEKTDEGESPSNPGTGARGAARRDWRSVQHGDDVRVGFCAASHSDCCSGTGIRRGVR